jgi:hypothetical protein
MESYLVMAVYNTSADAANTAVRAFLTKVGEFYLERKFNTTSGQGKADWERIRDVVFEGRCAYCGEGGVKLQIEHLQMFNRIEYGLHHPGNVVPCCPPCNKRKKGEDKGYVNWLEHLEITCKKRDEADQFQSRLQRIQHSITDENYPTLNQNEQHAIRVIANSLYENIKSESAKSLELYEQLDAAFGKNER